MLLLHLPGKLNKHRYNFFLFGPASFRFSQRPKVFIRIHFLEQNNKNKKYENPLAPTGFVTKKVHGVILIGWFW